MAAEAGAVVVVVEAVVVMLHRKAVWLRVPAVETQSNGIDLAHSLKQKK